MIGVIVGWKGSRFRGWKGSGFRLGSVVTMARIG